MAWLAKSDFVKGRRVMNFLFYEVNMKNNIPEVGKTYAFFDDGKTGLSRRYKATVLGKIPFEVAEELYPELFAGWKENLEEADFLYASTTDFFIKCSILKYDDDFVYFVRDIRGGWFSIDFPHNWMSGLLDVDEEYSKKNDIPPVERWVAGKDYSGED